MVGRNKKLQKLHERYPNISKFPIRQDPLYMENLKLMGVTMPTRFAKNDISIYSIMNKLFAKKFSPKQKCPSCGNSLKLIELNILAKAIGVFHQGSEVFCPGCGKGFRFMINRDHAKAEQLRKAGGLPAGL